MKRHTLYQREITAAFNNPSRLIIANCLNLFIPRKVCQVWHVAHEPLVLFKIICTNARVSENQIFLSVIWNDSLVCSTGPKQILSVQINSNDFHFNNKLFNGVLDYVLLIKKKIAKRGFLSTSIFLTNSLILHSFSLRFCSISDR